ncbi:MAG: ethanolamine permease [Sandaracinus sp.]|mgnify:CR=1 FL=1|nr:ethanolamine permease [Sandaracinus sp.]|tara:strand:- start:1253 stop:2722 length:1470 start_codon:yes stop_codon:yes gene_type:complete
MSEPERKGVSYDAVDEGYFEQRGLRRYAGVWSLWALGVGAVISGDFFGWNYGLEHGFGGMVVATGIATVMYLGLCFSIAEMAAALPHTGGAYSFARSSMGPWGAYVTGLAENLEYVLTPAVIVVGVGGYLGAVFGTDPIWEPAWWALCYAIFVGLNIAGVEASFRFTVLVTVLALAVLAVFWVGALPHFDWDLARGERGWFPDGAGGVFAAIPFAVWFFLAIEQLPLAAEEAHDPVRDLPRGLVWGLATLIVAAFLTLFLAAGIPPGTDALASSDEPLFGGLRTIFGEGLGAKALALLAVTGLIASFHSIVFAYGRQIYSLSRAGYFPRFLSVTHPTRKTPHVALVVGALVGYGVALVIHFLGSEHPVGAVLLNMAIFGAVIAYALQMISFLLLRFRRPGMERPYRSPLGIVGALLALGISLACLVGLFVVDPVYQKVVVATAVWYVLGLAYFAFFARHRLVFSPEEAFAERGAAEDSPPPSGDGSPRP